MCVIRNQMIRCSSKLTVSYLTIITKNHVFPTLANFCRNTKWFRCWKLYQKKKMRRHGMDKYLTGQKIWKCRGRASMCLKKQSSFNGWLRRPECVERNRRLWESHHQSPVALHPANCHAQGQAVEIIPWNGSKQNVGGTMLLTSKY